MILSLVVRTSWCHYLTQQLACGCSSHLVGCCGIARILYGKRRRQNCGCLCLCSSLHHPVDLVFAAAVLGLHGFSTRSTTCCSPSAADRSIAHCLARVDPGLCRWANLRFDINHLSAISIRQRRASKNHAAARCDPRGATAA